LVKGRGQAYKTPEDIVQNYGALLPAPLPLDATFAERDSLLPPLEDANAEDLRAKYIKAVLGIDPNELHDFAHTVARETAQVSTALRIAGNRSLANLLKVAGLEDYRLGKANHGLSEEDIVQKLVSIKKVLEIGEDHVTTIAPLPQIYAHLNDSLTQPKGAAPNSQRRRIHQRASPLRHYGGNTQRELTSALPEDIRRSFEFTFASKDQHGLAEQDNVERTLFLNWSLYYLELVDANERVTSGIQRQTQKPYYATLRALLNKRVVEGTKQTAHLSPINIRDERGIPEIARSIPIDTGSVENNAIAASRGLVALQHVPLDNQVPGYQPPLQDYKIPRKGATYRTIDREGNVHHFYDERTADKLTRRTEDLLQKMPFLAAPSPPRTVLAPPTPSLAEQFANDADPSLQEAFQGIASPDLNQLLIDKALGGDYSGPVLQPDLVSPSAVYGMFAEGADPATDLPLPNLADNTPQSNLSPVDLNQTRALDLDRRHQVRVSTENLQSSPPRTPARRVRTPDTRSTPGSPNVVLSPVRAIHLTPSPIKSTHLSGPLFEDYGDFEGYGADDNLPDPFEEPAMVSSKSVSASPKFLPTLEQVQQVQHVNELNQVRDQVLASTDAAEQPFPLQGEIPGTTVTRFSDLLESPATPKPKRTSVQALVPSPQYAGQQTSAIRSSRAKKPSSVGVVLSDVFERVRSLVATRKIPDFKAEVLFSTIPKKATYDETVTRIMQHVKGTKAFEYPIYVSPGSGETADDRKANERAIKTFQDTTLGFFADVFDRLKRNYPTKPAKGSKEAQQQALHISSSILQLYQAWYEKNKQTFEKIVAEKHSNEEGYLLFQHFKTQLELVLTGNAHLVRKGDRWTTIGDEVPPLHVPEPVPTTSATYFRDEYERRGRKKRDIDESEDEEGAPKTKKNPKDRASDEEE
jgi:hypothetical protein